MKPAILLLTLSMTAACNGKPEAVVPGGSAAAPALHRAYVVDHGRHSGVAIAASAVQAAIPTLEAQTAAPAYFEFGWGDAGYYPAEKGGLRLAVNALFRPSEATLHVMSLPMEPSRYFAGEVVEVCLSEPQLKALIAFVGASFRYDAEGRPIPSATGRYPISQFYEARGRYHLFNTSNDWTARALESAGFERSPRFRLTSTPVMRLVREQAQPCHG
ncbi:DUF2459 domain-containing protein [Stutzerimonas tarimensis]|uniref:DUF2459 domain-containing protein n=1 Tax=Stutzerimonas tarimensis TaxID=1507735 RepID=A0ABV7SZU3_9GAMM